MKRNKGMQGKKCSLVLWVLAVLLLSGGVSFPSKAAAQTKYVEIKSTAYDAYGFVNTSYEREYDEYGNETKQINYNADGKVTSILVYEYNIYGEYTRRTSCGADGTAYLVTEYQYDTKGNYAGAISYSADGSVSSSFQFEYDADGNRIKAVYYNADGSMSEKYEYEYDANGNQTEAACYNADGSLRQRNGYEYDRNGNPIKIVDYGPDGSVTGTNEQEYDGNGNRIKTISYNTDGSVRYSFEYEYDANRNLLRRIWHSGDGSVSYVRELYEYDENENAIKYARYDECGSLDSYFIYEYEEIEYIPAPLKENHFASYEGYEFYRDGDGNITCYDSAGTPVINEFKCDGMYTYFFQADGTAMKDRLSYHPDGEHIIYFDENGHEVFSDFANVRMSIAGNPVDDFCFFDVYGYLYVDVVTYDSTGTVLYYANPYGVLERGKWFQFSDTVMYPGENGLQPWEGAAGGYGYANADGTLMKDQWTYDWEGRLCYMQGNGVALYQ